MLKQTIAGRLDLPRYLERGAVYLAAGMSIPEQAACEQEADEQWRTGSGCVYTFDFDGWSVNIHFDPEERFSHDTIDFFGHCGLPGFAAIAGASRAACAVEGATTTGDARSCAVLAIASSAATMSGALRLLTSGRA